MDTILYFYKKRGLQAPVAEPLGMKSNLLIRVALDVGQEEWFGRKLCMERETPHSSAVEAGTPWEEPYNPGASTGRRRGIWAGLLRFLWQREDVRGAESKGERCRKQTDKAGTKDMGGQKPVTGTKRKKKNRRLLDREEIQAREEWQRRVEEVDNAVGRLAALAEEWAGGFEECFCVYEDSVRKALLGDGADRDEKVLEGKLDASDGNILAKLWRRHLPLEEFHGYLNRMWVEQLLKGVEPFHYVILGRASCLPAVLETYAHRMKSLKWILPENDCDQELETFVEDFYTEFGLAIVLQRIPAGRKRVQFICAEPSVILDFTGEPGTGMPELAEGSVWLDMLSVEEKRRRIAGRMKGVQYDSLKERWKTVQRKKPFMP